MDREKRELDLTEESMRVVRKGTTAGKEVLFAFEEVGSQFVIANFTGSSLIARLGDEDKTGVMVPAQAARVVVTRINPRMSDAVNKVYVKAEETVENGCEIQMLDY